MIGAEGGVGIHRLSEIYLQFRLAGQHRDHRRLVTARNHSFRKRNAIEIALGGHLPRQILRELETWKDVGFRNCFGAGHASKILFGGKALRPEFSKRQPRAIRQHRGILRVETEILE